MTSISNLLTLFEKSPTILKMLWIITPNFFVTGTMNSAESDNLNLLVFTKLYSSSEKSADYPGFGLNALPTLVLNLLTFGDGTDRNLAYYE